MFSVVIPLYNKEKYILRAVESVLKQDFKDFELIIVDDGSTDESLGIIKKINDSRLYVIQQENKGEGPARNTGMCAAKNEWTAFLDADDAWLPYHLSELNNIITKFNNVGMVSTACIEIKDSSRKINIDENKVDSIYSINYFNEAAKTIGVINSTSVAIRRDVLNKVGGFSKFKAGGDLEYWARVALHFPVAVSNKVTCCYFRDTGGIMQSVSGKEILPVSSLSEVSPSVSFLIKESKTYISIMRDKNIRKYINSRLFNGVKVALFRRDFPVAKSYSRLALPQLNLLFLFLLLLRITPSIVLSNIVTLYFFVRK